MSARTCGTCVYCCKAMGVSELRKPADTWCSLVQIGGKTPGCSDYENRPAGCRDFECLWLHSSMPDQFRPDRIKALLTATMDGESLVVRIDPATPDHWRTNKALHSFITAMRSKLRVIIVCGEKRTMF